MLRHSLQSVTLAIALSVFAAPAHAWPLGRLLHLHPDAHSASDGRVSFALYNRSGIIQDVTIGDQKYTLMPHYGMTVNAPAGTQIISGTTGLGHKKGDVLVSVNPGLRDSTVIIR